jgi:hypothetical protein
MSTRRFILAALVVLPLALAGCKINTINSFPTKAAPVRAVNVMNDAPVLDMTVAGATTFPGVAFEGWTDFVNLDNVDTTFAVKQPNSTSPLVQSTVSLFGEQPYTLIAYGTLAAPSLVLLPDAPEQPGGGRSQVRVANVAIGVGTVDLYVTAPGADITAVGPNSSGITYGGATTYLQFSPGTYQLRITGSGTKTVIYDTGTITLSDNTSSDLIVYARSSGRLPNALLLDTNGASQRRIANNTLASVKFVNAAPQAATINVLLDGTALFSSVAYPQPTGYATVAAGAHTVAFEDTATPGAPIATATPTLAPATDTTVIVTGLAGQTHAVVLSDNNRPSLAGNGRLRFVNATSAGVAAVDVLVNNVKVASNVAADAASPYVEVAPGNPTVTFVDSVTGVPLAAPVVGTAVGINTQQTGTVYLVGSPNALAQVFLVED